MTRRLLLPLALLAALVAVGAAPAGAATTCPATFRVLHDDAIGKLKLPKGNYRMTAAGVSCDAASDLFANFLQDFDGVLPKPWRTVVNGVGKGTFRRGSSGVFVTVTKVGSASGGGSGGNGDYGCPGAYTVLHNDRIGALLVPKGRYRISLLTQGRLTCGQAARLLDGFLEDFDGHLPGGWVVLPESGTFVKGSVSYGFRIKKFTGGGGGGGGHSRRETRCPATFRVLHNDRIGPLRFPAGPYYIDVVGLSCANATSLFRQFLLRPDGSLPSPWTIDKATGKFQRRGSKANFEAKPAFVVP